MKPKLPRLKNPVPRLRTLHHKVLQHERINFLLTNRVPRIALTRFMGWYSGIRNPLLAAAPIKVWRFFAPDLDLSESPKKRYRSLQECFTRTLKPDARPVTPDPGVFCSPCDAIVGACGEVAGTRVFQAKGFPYKLEELFGSNKTTAPFKDGVFATLRLTSGMYHRFHAPHDLDVEHVTYISGDTWNVNPIALRRVEKLFCRNERALIHARLREGGWPIMLVPVAAILVASLRLKFVDVRLHLRYEGPNQIPVQASLNKGDEMGWFEHGSTILVFAPKGFTLAEGLVPGSRIRLGQPLLRLPSVTQTETGG